MKYLHVNNINGLLVEYNNKLVLVLVTPLEDQGTVQFDFIDPFTDLEVLDDDEARALLLELMEDNK